MKMKPKVVVNNFLLKLKFDDIQELFETVPFIEQIKSHKISGECVANAGSEMLKKNYEIS
jgi:hypothetical protein